MARVEIPGVGIVNFPDTMPRNEIMARAEAIQAEASKPLVDPKELGLGQLLKGGASRGLESLKGTAVDLIPALGASMIGKQDYAKEQLQEYQQRMADVESLHPTAYKSYKDIQSLGDVLGFGAETLGELGPDILSFIGGAGVGAQIGKRVAKKGVEEALQAGAAKEGAKLGSTIGLTSASMATNVPDVFQSIYQDTGTLQPGIALTVGPIVGMLDTFLPGRILKQLGPEGKQVLATQLLDKATIVPTTWKKAFAGELLKNVSLEGLTEGTQQALQVAASQIAGDKKGFFDPQNIDSIITASLKGAIGGGAIGSPTAAIEAGRIKRDRQDEINAQQAAAQEQAAQPQQPLALGYTAPPAMQQVETDPTRRPIEVSPGVIYDPVTGVYTTQEAEPTLGRAVNPTVPTTQGNPELVGLGAPAVELSPAQQEMLGTTAFERKAPTSEQALAGPPIAPEEFKTVLDADSLKGTGLKPQSGFYKKLLNKDLTVPADQKEVAKVLAEVRNNSNLTPDTKKAIENIAMNAFGALSTQQEMFGRKGNVLKGADYGRVQPRPADQAGGASVSVPVQQVPDVTEGVGTPEQPGLEPAGSVTSDVGSREAVQPDTLTEEAPSEPTAEVVEPAVAPEVIEPAVQAPVAEQVAEEVAPPAPKAALTRQERAFLEDHVLSLKAEKRLTKDAELIRALDEEIANTEADLKAGKAQVGEGAALFRGDVSKLAKDMRSALDKMGLHKVAVNLEKALFDAEGNPVQGFYNNKLIQVALSANDPGFTLDHEALHAMRELGFFSPNDWGILSNMAKNSWLKKYSIESKYPTLDKEAQIEEAVAEAFATFQQQPPNVQSLMTKVVNTLRRIGNFLRGYGFKAPDDILGKAASGQLARDRAHVIDKFGDYLDTIPNAEVKYQVNAQKEIWNGVEKVINATPYLTETQKDAIDESIKRAAGAAKSAILSLLPMHALGEVANGVFPGLGTKFNTLINERSGYQDTLNRGTDAVVEEAKRAIKARPDQHKAYDTLVNESTVNEVDPTKPRSEYIKDKDKLAEYDKLFKEYNKLDKVWKDLYITMRDGYKQMYEEIKKSISARIDETDLDADTKKSVKASILTKLAEKGMIEPYFALGREGQYWLASEYVDKAGQKQFTVEAFKSDRARKNRMEKLLKDGATRSDPYDSLAQVDYRRAPTGSFVNSVLNILDTNKPKDGPAAERFEKAIDEMMRLFLTTLPETAFAQSFQKRKGTAGYMEDTIGVFERKMRNTAHQVANMMYNPKLTAVVDEMEAQTNTAGAMGKGNALEKKYLDEFKKHLGYVLSPTKNDIGSILTSAAFTYTLGFNLSSALVNMANVPMIVAPYLKGKYADSSVARAIGDATKLFTGSGLKTNMPIIGADGRTTGMRVMPSITNYAPDSEMGKRYATLIRIGNEQGQFNRSQLYEIINGDTRTGVMAKFNAMSGWMFHHGERMNREVTMVATYNLELDRLMKDKPKGLNEADSKAFDTQAETQAANTAIYTTELTNGGISAAAAPRIAQNPIGKMFFMYKRYGVSMYYMMFKTAKEALKGETKEARQAAMRQLGGIVGMSALMAGAQGIPMYGALSLVYSLFTDDDEDDLDAVTQKALGDFLYKGPVEYATNLAIAGRITLNDLIIRDAPKGSASTFSQQLAQALGGPVVGVADRIQRGYSKMNEGNVSRAMEDLLPSAIANGFKAYRYATEGTKTLRGDPITGEVSLYNAVAQALGFAPADYTRQLEINAREKGIDKIVNTEASKQKQKYYIAKREGDIDGMNDARDKLLEIGAKHPGMEITPATVNDVLKRSLKAQERATKEMINGVRYNKKRLKEVQASLAEYED
jgi:hypothetical protein